MKAALLVESLTGNTWKAGEMIAGHLQQVGWGITGLSRVREPDYAAFHVVTMGTRASEREQELFKADRVAQLLLAQLQRSGAEDTYELLSPREREILQLVAEGNSSKEIASTLNLSVYTVETHRARVMQKLNLRGIPELTLYAVRKGIIS